MSCVSFGGCKIANYFEGRMRRRALGPVALSLRDDEMLSCLEGRLPAFLMLREQFKSIYFL